MSLIERLELDIVLYGVAANEVELAQMPHATSSRYPVHNMFFLYFFIIIYEKNIGVFFIFSILLLLFLISYAEPI